MNKKISSKISSKNLNIFSYSQFYMCLHCLCTDLSLKTYRPLILSPKIILSQLTWPTYIAQLRWQDCTASGISSQLSTPVPSEITTTTMLEHRPGLHTGEGIFSRHMDTTYTHGLVVEEVGFFWGMSISM